jgi:hypothetical protein
MTVKEVLSTLTAKLRENLTFLELALERDDAISAELRAFRAEKIARTITETINDARGMRL